MFAVEQSINYNNKLFILYNRMVVKFKYSKIELLLLYNHESLTNQHWLLFMYLLYFCYRRNSVGFIPDWLYVSWLSHILTLICTNMSKPKTLIAMSKIFELREFQFLYTLSLYINFSLHNLSEIACSLVFRYCGKM